MTTPVEHGPECPCTRCVGFTSETAADAGKRGGEAGTTHGARSTRHLRPRADRILTQLQRMAPTASDPADEIAFERLAMQIAKIEALEEWLDTNGLLDDHGEVRSAVKQLGQLEGSVRRLMGELGLTAQSRRDLANGDYVHVSELVAWMRTFLGDVIGLVPERRAELLALAAIHTARVGGKAADPVEALEPGEVIAETDEPVRASESGEERDPSPDTTEGALGHGGSV